MSLSRTLWLFMTFMVGLSLAASSLSHQTKEESLKNALAAVTRKQRSLNSLPQDYYNDLRSFKYHGEPVIKYDREEIPDLDEDEEELEFLPLADNGQLETIGGGFQNLNNKRLERALIDYLDSPSVQKEAVSSLFRERERSGNRKRTLNSKRFNANDKELARLFVEGLQNCAPSGEDREEAEYQPVDLSQPIYDRYKFETTNKLDTPISWANVFPKNQNNNDENLALSDTYKNVPVKVGGGYVMLSVPVSRKNKEELYADTRQGHRDITKHYPITKRSPKPLAKSQVTDPKIAQDLGALFGNEEYNKTNNDNTKKLLSQIPKIETNVSPDHGNMDHIHLSKSNGNDNGNSNSDTTTTRNPNPTVRSISRKEQQINMGKGLEHPIDVRKKSVDWSQYFGIDRRRKKTSLLARPDTQDQDDEWLLQKYYKTMADNLKTPIKDMMTKNNGEKRDKLDQMDEKLKNVKNLIVEDAVRYSTTGDNNDSQEVKDIVMARLAAAYSLEKMRKALNEFRNSITAQRDIQRASSSHIKNDNSSNENKEKKQINNHDKRNNNMDDDDDDDDDDEGIPLEIFDEERSSNCPELEAYEIVCKPAKNIPGLFAPCVMHQVCKSCNNEDECMVLYAMEVAQICNNLPIDDDSRSYCAKTAVDIASQLDSSEFGNSLCHGTIADNCLRRFRNRHRTSSYPYAQKQQQQQQQQQQHHHSVNNNGFDMTMKR